MCGCLDAKCASRRLEWDGYVEDLRQAEQAIEAMTEERLSYRVSEATFDNLAGKHVLISYHELQQYQVVFAMGDGSMGRCSSVLSRKKRRL